ncbi:MAG TPA: ATP-grasp domain-containing protein [archaeon]|nr:ATP-grasp domain-containing protein [archaeon]
MNILIVSNEQQWEINQLEKEALKRGHFVSVLKPEEIIADFDSKESYDIVLFRPLAGKAVQGRAIAKSFISKNIDVVDEKIAYESGGNKFNHYSEFKQAGLNIPKTIFLNKAGIELIKKGSFAKEIVVKEIGGKRGAGVYRTKPENLEELLKKIDKKKDFIAQEFIQFEKEFRVLVVGAKVLGMFSKHGRNWIKNISKGGKAKKEKLTKSHEETALVAARSAKLEIAGVDLALYKKKLYVLEANRTPQFKAFQETHPKINVAEEIIKFLEMKFHREY